MTDCEFVLHALKDGNWRSLNSLLQQSFAERGCGLTIHSRISDLRARGHVIEHRMVGRRGNGSLYRLVSLADREAGPMVGSLPSPAVSRSASETEQLELVPPVPERRGYTWEAA